MGTNTIKYMEIKYYIFFRLNIIYSYICTYKQRTIESVTDVCAYYLSLNNSYFIGWILSLFQNVLIHLISFHFPRQTLILKTKNFNFLQMISFNHSYTSSPYPLNAFTKWLDIYFTKTTSVYTE